MRIVCDRPITEHLVLAMHPLSVHIAQHGRGYDMPMKDSSCPGPSALLRLSELLLKDRVAYAALV